MRSKFDKPVCLVCDKCDSPVYDMCNIVLPIFYTVLCIVFN